MEESSRFEEIGLEYLVEFNNGIKPKVTVYAINPEAKEVFGIHARIGLSIRTGYKLQRAETVQELGKGKEEFRNATFLTDIIMEDFKEELLENSEEKLYETAREYGWNLIKVKDPEHIRPVIYLHKDLYQEQFKELAEECEDLFEEFLKKYPDYRLI